MRCLVTGATGFVGGRLCEELAAAGHEVLAMARPTSNRARLEKIGVRIVTGTIDSLNVFAHLAEEIDVVFHLAAVTKPLRDEDFDRVNHVGTKRMLRGLKRGEFQGRIVFLSSLAAGGPVRDPSTPRRETDPDAPVSLYGKSKKRAEKALLAGLPEGCSAVVLRPGAIYGPHEHEIFEVLRMFSKQGLAVQIGRSVNLQLTHVDDVVAALVLAAESPDAAGKCYYLTDRKVWSFQQIATHAAEALGKRVRVIRLPDGFGKPLALTLDWASRLAKKSLAPFGRDKHREMLGRNWVCDPTRLETELGWRAKIGFPEGLRDTIDWYRDEGWL